jgi:hypothetical protein
MEKGTERVAHGQTTDGGEIVRYDRAGKWYVEYPASTYKPRRLLTLASAVEAAVQGVVYLGRYGGTQFDAKVRKHPDWQASL